MTVDLVAADEALWASWLESRSECGGPQADQPDSASRVSQRLDVDLASLDGFGQRVRGFVGQLRLSMNEFLADVGGHIGHGVRRSEGRKGIASTALGEVLAYVGDPVGLSRVLVTCDERNPVSRKAIEACGGLLESVRPADQLSRNVGCSRDTLRYWVRTSVSSVR